MPVQRRPIPVLTPSLRYRKPVRGSLVWWLRCFGVVAFLVILLRLPALHHDVQLFRIDLRWLGFCMWLTILQLLLEAFVWQRLLVIQHIPHPYPKTLLAYLSSQYLGLVTPGHVGEFLAAGYISMETGITFGYALSSVVMKKALAWLTMAVFGCWGLPLLAQVPLLKGVQRIAVLGVIVLVVLSVAIAVWVVSLRRLARKWQTLSPWQIDMTEFWAGMRQLASVRLIVPLTLAVLAFSLLFLQLNAILRSLGVVAPLMLVAKIMALSRILARIIPISIAGFGSKDAAIIVLLTQQGIEFSVGLTVTLLLLMCSHLVILLLSGLAWWIKPLVVRRAGSARS